MPTWMKDFDHGVGVENLDMDQVWDLDMDPGSEPQCGIGQSPPRG